MLSRLLVVLLLSTLVACSDSGPPPSPTIPSPAPPAPAPPPEPAPTRWSLTGAVLDAAAQTPVASAKIEIVEGPNSGASATTGDEGRFRLENLEPGTFSLQAKAEGFENESRTVTLTGDQVLDIPLRKTSAPSPPPPPTPPSRRLTGTIVDGVTDRPLGGVTLRVEGLDETTTGPDGAFQLEVIGDIEQVRPVVISSPMTVERTTKLRVPGPSATLSLMPRSLDLRAFDEMFRHSGALRRWTQPPTIVVQRRVLQFTSTSDTEYTALDTAMTDDDATALLGDLTWALPQLSGNAFSRFAEERRETAATGARVMVQRGGLIVLARYEGLAAATGFWGYSRWAWNEAGEIQAGIIMLDRSFDTSNSPYLRSLRAHELGHALGYQHVTARDSVMNASARLEPNSFDRDSAKLAFLRPPLNRAPDIDPDPFTGNLRSLADLIWSKGMP